MFYHFLLLIAIGNTFSSNESSWTFSRWLIIGTAIEIHRSITCIHGLEAFIDCACEGVVIANAICEKITC